MNRFCSSAQGTVVLSVEQIQHYNTKNSCLLVKWPVQNVSSGKFLLQNSVTLIMEQD